MDLDGRPGAESAVDLNVLQTAPPRLESKVTNRTNGDAFSFSWKSAGPGGFTSSTPAGRTTGVGAKWVWSTNQTVYAFTGTICAKDICFTKTAGPDPVTTRGPFSVPGRSLFATGVTVSNAALTSSLITFFSPPQEVFRATSSVSPSPGGIAIRETLTNLTGAVITVSVDPGPPGCCPEEGQIHCDGECFDWRTDEGNCGGCGLACGAGETCSEGACVGGCPEPRILCGDRCVDTGSDRENCGECDNACGGSSVCVEGGCQACKGDVCGNACVNLGYDVENCGECGNDCTQSCKDGAYCYGGECYCGGGPDLTFAPSAGEVVTRGIGTGEGGGVEEAPLCETSGYEVTIEPGSSSTQCAASQGFLAKEVPTTVTVCGDAIPEGEAACPGGALASQGTFMKLVPDPSKPIGDAFLTPFAVHVQDPSKDGLIQPGETVWLVIEVLNAGPQAIREMQAQLKSPPVDLTDDGVNNPVGVAFLSALSSYGDVLGTPAGTADCGDLAELHPGVNATRFRVTFPSTHPGDVARPFILSATGNVGGFGAFAMEMPLSLGIADRCDPAAQAGDFDGLDGLLSPLAQLVPEGEPLVYPAKTFNQGQTIPAKLRILCGGVNLRSGEIEEPEIVGIVPLGGSALALDRVAFNADGPDPFDPNFAFNATFQQWNFNIRTDDLAPGTYVLKIRIGGSKVYDAVFVLR